jgi:hypothetical protein
MFKTPRIFIDCNASITLFENWPMKAMIQKSKTANVLLKNLGNQWTLETADLSDKGYHINDEQKIITIDTSGLSKEAIARSDKILDQVTWRSFAALRAAHQSEYINRVRAIHRPDLWLLLGRIIEADIKTMSLRMAYEAKWEGHETIWRSILGGDYTDMAINYTQQRERTPFSEVDAAALEKTFKLWFLKQAHINDTDLETLTEMDAFLSDLTMEGLSKLEKKHIKCLTLDPITQTSYLDDFAEKLSQDHKWKTIKSPMIESHFLQVMGEIGTIRQGAVAIRDKKLAARLFPEMLITV